MSLSAAAAGVPAELTAEEASSTAMHAAMAVRRRMCVVTVVLLSVGLLITMGRHGPGRGKPERLDG
jgi:hypothetical protein